MPLRKKEEREIAAGKIYILLAKKDFGKKKKVLLSKIMKVSILKRNLRTRLVFFMAFWDILGLAHYNSSKM